MSKDAMADALAKASKKKTGSSARDALPSHAEDVVSKPVEVEASAEDGWDAPQGIAVHEAEKAARDGVEYDTKNHRIDTDYVALTDSPADPNAVLTDVVSDVEFADLKDGPEPEPAADYDYSDHEFPYYGEEPVTAPAGDVDPRYKKLPPVGTNPPPFRG
jgi:hypothetical protein